MASLSPPARAAAAKAAEAEGAASSTDYESSDDEWRPPFIDAETGASAFDEETGTFPYGTLSSTASTVVSPDGVTQRFLEMLRNEHSQEDGDGKHKRQQQQPVHLPSYFVDIGCGKGRVVNKIASELGCRCVGVDISQKELDVAAEGARALGVASLVSFVVRDFRQFHVEIPDDVMPSDVLCYIYLIPKMVNNRDLRSQVVRLLEQGATFVCWQYLPRDWPHLWKEDTKFGIQIYRRGDL
jgi:SAM-dependent methyltransferase